MPAMVSMATAKIVKITYVYYFSMIFSYKQFVAF